MCRNIKMLFNFDPPVSPDEIQAASLQFVRKISGFNKPSKANEEAFQLAVHAISGISANLLSSLRPTLLRRAGKKNRHDLKLATQKGSAIKELQPEYKNLRQDRRQRCRY